MKKRTFYLTFSLFFIFFNLAILLVCTTLLRDSLNTQKDRCLAEHYVIVSSLTRDLQALDQRGVNFEDSLEELMWAYRYFSQDRKLGLALFQDDVPFYSNCDMTAAPLAPSALEFETRQVVVQRGEQPTLFIIGRLPEPFEAYSLAYQFDLSEDFSAWRRTKNTLLVTGGGFSLVLALCLLWLMEHLFRPLGQISEASKRIAAGEYQERLPSSGRDELAELAASFNDMVDEIERQMGELRNAAEQKQQFIDNFAHELRTPLTTIYGYAEYLQKAAISEEERYSATEFIMGECHRLQTMAYQLLDLALLRGGNLDRCEVPLDELFSRVEELTQSKAVECGVQLHFQRQLTGLMGNQDLLQSLLINLIENAVKACDRGGLVTVRAEIAEGIPTLSIQDNGRGMTEEQLLHSREAFYRVDKARSRRDGGAGLGLSLCEQIAQVHSAELAFSSTLGAGTLVKVRFYNSMTSR